jgi:YfiH family protein
MPEHPSDIISTHDLIEPDWLAPGNVRAFSTTRNCGFSKGPWSQFNLGAHCGDHPEDVAQNRKFLRTLLPSDPPWLRQVHGTAVTSWNDMRHSDVGEDAIVSNQPGQVCAVLTADCLPVLFCNKTGTKVAAAHAGWRGLAAGILEATVEKLGCHSTELLAWLGPAIGPQAFEVGNDVYGVFVELNADHASAFRPHGDRLLADLYKLARLKLSGMGIEKISGGQFCTYTDKDKFFSYRRDGQTGRMATLIWIDE